jgi:hypothetical protein
MRRLFAFLFIVALVFGASYAAALINRVMGPWSAVGVLADGSLTHMQFGPHLPRPEWGPFYPGATVVGASRVTSAQVPSGAHSLDLATRASLDEVRRFYTERLTAAGFEVVDTGILSLNPATAWMLGIAGSLTAKRAATDDAIDIQIRTADGLIASRLLQIHWRRISEFPLLYPAPPQPAPAGGT